MTVAARKQSYLYPPTRRSNKVIMVLSSVPDTLDVQIVRHFVHLHNHHRTFTCAPAATVLAQLHYVRGFSGIQRTGDVEEAGWMGRPCHIFSS